MSTFKAFPVINMAATGDNIQRLRKERGLTVTDLQTYFGFDAPQAIYKWQRGETLPSTDNLLALGFILGVPIEKLLAFQTIEQNEPQDNSCGFDVFGKTTSLDSVFSHIKPMIAEIHSCPQIIRFRSVKPRQRGFPGFWLLLIFHIPMHVNILSHQELPVHRAI